MNYWIFQCKKDRFDISEPQVLFDGMTGRWDANQFRSEMFPGDIVFFWLAGDENHRGIYGVGELTSTPYQYESESIKRFYVNVICNHRLSQHLSIEEIKNNKNLQGLQILKVRVGSNFILSKLEGEVIDAMAKKYVNGGVS